MPDVKFYYTAVQLCRCVATMSRQSNSLCSRLENVLFTNQELLTLWGIRPISANHYYSSPVWKGMLVEWSKMVQSQIFNFPNHCMPLNLLQSHIHPAVLNPTGIWSKLADISLRDVLLPDGSLNWDSVIDLPEVKAAPFFHLANFQRDIKKCIGPFTGNSSSSWLEKKVLATKPSLRPLSLMYREILSSLPPELHYVTSWERALSLSLTEPEKAFILAHSHGFNRCVRIQENSFKLLSRWYKTPEFLHKLNPEVPELCWRCGTGTGSLSHIWWLCHKIQPFWKSIEALVNQICNTKISLDAKLVLLWCPNSSLTPAKHDLPTMLLTAAKLLIPFLWKNDSPPTLPMWTDKVDQIYSFEELAHWENNSRSRFLKVWSPWKAHRNFA